MELKCIVESVENFWHLKVTDEKVKIILALLCESQFHPNVDLTKMLSFSCAGDMLLTAHCEKPSYHWWILIFFFYLHSHYRFKIIKKKKYCIKVVKDLCILSRNSISWNNLGAGFSLKMFTYPITGVLEHQQPRVSLALFHGSPTFLRPRIPWLSISAPVKLLQDQVSAPHSPALPGHVSHWTETIQRPTALPDLVHWSVQPDTVTEPWTCSIAITVLLMPLVGLDLQHHVVPTPYRMLWGWALPLSPSLVSTRTPHLPIPHLWEGSPASVCS